MTSPDVRASDADRERLATQLRDHLAAGRLTLDELSERLDAVYRARTVGELEQLMRDLPATTAQAPASPPGRKPTRWSVAVMGSVERKRRWRVPEHSTAVAFMGAVELDLRQAELTSGEVEIVAIAIMGAVEIVVPPGVEVELSGLAIMGAREENVSDAPVLPGAPRIRIRAFALMGAVEVSSKPRTIRRPPGPPAPLGPPRPPDL
jgi:hypothetical protein